MFAYVTFWGLDNTEPILFSTDHHYDYDYGNIWQLKLGLTRTQARAWFVHEACTRILCGFYEC